MVQTSFGLSGRFWTIRRPLFHGHAAGRKWGFRWRLRARSLPSQRRPTRRATPKGAVCAQAAVGSPSNEVSEIYLAGEHSVRRVGLAQQEEELVKSLL